VIRAEYNESHSQVFILSNTNKVLQQSIVVTMVMKRSKSDRQCGQLDLVTG
jgi:hypothetical protein